MEIILTEDQKRTIQYVKQGFNIFLTGMAGTGKSFVIEEIVKLKKSEKLVIGVTSTTGISAKNINGVTLHSFLGIGLGKDDIDTMYKNTFLYKKYFMLKKLDCLIIDEVSMLDINLFEKIEILFKKVKNNNSFFGGLQIILCGDFLQLPPVKNEFIFKSKIWDFKNIKPIVLKEIIRQKDKEFCEILNKIRVGNVDEQVSQFLESRNNIFENSCEKDTEKNTIIPTKLFSVNYKVSLTNQESFDKINETEYIFTMNIKIKKEFKNYKKYFNEIRLEETVCLKKGVQVMYMINKSGLVNGSRGIVVDFINGFPLVLFKELKEPILVLKETLNIKEIGTNSIVVSYTQIPLKLAYALSIHKSQGSTLDMAIIDSEEIFENGQFYVAMSRVKNKDSLFIKNLNINTIKTDMDAVKFYERLN